MTQLFIKTIRGIKIEHGGILINMEHDLYIEYLKSHKKEGVKRAGAVVINCNPFTLGHRYLIDTALNMVDFLYVFVVEEDRSYFPFEVRYNLVNKGINDLNNVSVLKSGKLILSAFTFPEYFRKENSKTVTIDAALDIEMFCKFIVPVLNISVRFAGDEMYCDITRQYNMAMKEILPCYNVEFVELTRKCINDEAISASKVRNLFKERNFERIKELVPLSTYSYLMSDYTLYDEKL